MTRFAFRSPPLSRSYPLLLAAGLLVAVAAVPGCDRSQPITDPEDLQQSGENRGCGEIEASCQCGNAQKVEATQHAKLITFDPVNR